MITYRRENNLWKYKGELERPDNVKMWNQFGNAVMLRSGVLIINSKESGYVGGYDSGFHTYLKNPDGSWSLQSQYWDERNTNAVGKMGHSFYFDKDTLITTNTNTIASHHIVEFYRRGVQGTLIPEQAVPIQTRRANVLVDGDTAVIDDGGTLRLLRRHNTKFEEVAAITGGKYLVYAGKLWETDVPYALTDFNINDRTIFWDDERNYFPVSLNLVEADDDSSGSQLTDDPAPDDVQEDPQAGAALVDGSEGTEASQDGTSANDASEPSDNSGGGSVHFVLLWLLLIPGFWQGTRGIARLK